MSRHVLALAVGFGLDGVVLLVGEMIEVKGGQAFEVFRGAVKGGDGQFVSRYRSDPDQLIHR